jgi:hypothetical protein
MIFAYSSIEEKPVKITGRAFAAKPKLILRKSARLSDVVDCTSINSEISTRATGFSGYQNSVDKRMQLTLSAVKSRFSQIHVTICQILVDTAYGVI